MRDRFDEIIKTLATLNLSIAKKTGNGSYSYTCDEDLRLEQARGITVKIKQCQPEHLTICGLESK